MYTDQQIRDWFAQNPNMPVDQVAALMRNNGVSTQQVSQATGRDLQEVQTLYNNAQIGIQPSYSNQDIQHWFAQNPNMPADQVAKLMRQYGVSPEQVSQATGFGQGYVTDLYNKGNRLGGAGLNPAFQTLSGGGDEATRRIGDTQQRVGDIYNQGLGYLQPYMNSGGQAQNLQAALSGAMGPEAQAQAFANYQQSPGVAFAQQEAERALTRNASATGGLGGGNVLRELTKLAAGTFMQDYNNQFGQIGQVADRGYGAATTGAGLRGQEGQVQAGLGQFSANIPLQTAGAQAGMQFQAGRDIASGIQQTTSSLSNLINQQGAGMTDILGNATTNISTLYQNAMNGDANAKEQLAAMLGNLSTQNASMVGGLPMIQQQPSNLLGQVGQVASGIGGMMYGMNQTPAQQTQPTTPNSAYGPYATTYGLAGLQ